MYFSFFASRWSLFFVLLSFLTWGHEPLTYEQNHSILQTYPDFPVGEDTFFRPHQEGQRNTPIPNHSEDEMFILLGFHCLDRWAHLSSQNPLGEAGSILTGLNTFFHATFFLRDLHTLSQAWHRPIGRVCAARSSFSLIRSSAALAYVFTSNEVVHAASFWGYPLATIALLTCNTFLSPKQ